MRRYPTAGVLVLGCLFGLGLQLIAGCGATRTKPNVVVIMADDMGFSDIGRYGSEIHTPNIDTLAKEGVVFTQFYNMAKCSQSRASLLTGLHHQQTNLLKRVDNNVTLAELLSQAGYETIMSGKWHLGQWKQEQNTPTQRGFDHFFGFLGGAINFYTGKDWGTGKNYMRKDRAVYKVPDNFYATDNFTDYAIKKVENSVRKATPFFLYLSYNAPHFPLQVPEVEIEKYEDMYNAGWDSIRQQRLRKMKELGIVNPQQELTKRDSLIPAWETLSEQQQQQEQWLMATYAGMVDRMDQQIGRLMHHLEKLGVSDNTLVLFLSDNGGNPFNFNRTPGKRPGPADALRSYNVEWANVSNTPFKKYKQWMHEGGISSPLIVRWPQMLENNNVVTTPTHIVDIMPTILDLVSVPYPDTYKSRNLLAFEGISKVGDLQSEPLIMNKPLYWEFNGSRAVRWGKWKLVAERGGAWELYDMETGRTERVNIINKQQNVAQKMEKMYRDWSQRVGAMPDSVARNMSLNRRTKFTLSEN